MEAAVNIFEAIPWIVLQFAMSVLPVILWVAAAVSLVCALIKKKVWNYEYSRKDRIAYGLNWLLIGFILWCCAVFWASGFFETEDWRVTLSNILGMLVFILPPLSVCSIAASISLRKDGRSRDSFLVQFSTVPVYLAGLIVCDLCF